MVGVLAVSAPLEDYTAQPCKRQRKDEDPQGKTITNYFSPLSKAVDKGLASPKSSNIADYFIRTPPAASRECTPKPTSPRSRSKEAPSTPLTPPSKPSGRGVKQGKRTRLLKRLGDTVPPSDAAASNGGGNHAPSGIMGSDTAALLAEICSHTADLGGEEEDDDVVFQSETFTTTTPPRGHTLKRRTSAEVEQQVNVEPPSRGSSALRPPLISSVSSEGKTSLGDSSLEVQVDTSDNLGTLTISFEDFMRNQGTKQESTSPGDTSDVTSAAEDDQEAGQMPSPKTMTIQAQVHLSPPLQPQNSTKIASIFKKSKMEHKTTEAMATECDKMGPVVSKIKSNVVIQEEDLELAVIDVEAGEASKSKSTPAERQQFMKAFQQVGEAPRAKTKKNPTKKKDLKEGTEDHHKLEADEQQPPDKAAAETDKASKLKRKTQPPSVDMPKSTKPAEKEKVEQMDKASKLKRRTQPPSVDMPKSTKPAEKEVEQMDKASKLKRRTQPPSVDMPKSTKPAEKEVEQMDKASKLKRRTQPPSVDMPKSTKPAEKEVEQMDKASKLKRRKIKQSVEDQKSSKPAEKQPTPPHGNPVLRRSLRRSRSSPSRSPPRMVADSPVLMSTPKVKTPCRKNVYRAEVLTEVSDVQSPIRMRFTRVTRNTRRRQEDEASTPGCIKVSQSTKKLSKARQLVEKAKAIQQSMVKAEAPERRVTRQRSHRTQGPLVIADASISQKNERKTTTLRSLNDVLGKKMRAKGLGHSGHKEVKKGNKGGVITIDDRVSREVVSALGRSSPRSSVRELTASGFRPPAFAQGDLPLSPPRVGPPRTFPSECASSQVVFSPMVDPTVSRLSKSTTLPLAYAASFKDPSDKRVENLAKFAFEAAGSVLSPAFASTSVSKALSIWA
ncbi:ATPase family AAA domain-containing protein 5-like, partial [Hyla sarda]|uniref:ATPase family AAA domain-containing protein 5-like n=1 Tax=Hyla sarda TaxID=327740 RepID=UPI0024C3E271